MLRPRSPRGVIFATVLFLHPGAREHVEHGQRLARQRLEGFTRGPGGRGRIDSRALGSRVVGPLLQGGRAGARRYCCRSRCLPASSANWLSPASR